MKVTANQYAKTLLELTDGKSEQEVSDIVKKFALQLQKDSQLKNSNAIIQKFSELYNQKNGIVKANVISSRKLESDQVHKIESFLKERYDAKEIETEIVVDEKIKGGIVLKVGDEVMDASISNRLKRLKKVLAS